MNENSRASAILAETICAVNYNKPSMSCARNFRHHELARLFCCQSVFSPAAQIGCAKIAPALLLQVIFFQKSLAQGLVLILSGDVP